MIQSIFALIRKDLVLEWRRKEALVLSLSLSLLLSLTVSLGMHSAFLGAEEARAIFTPLVWIVSIFAATVSLGRSFEYETEFSAIDGLILSAVPLWQAYLSKVCVNFLVSLLSQLVAIASLSGFLNIDLSGMYLSLTFLSVGVMWGYAALATLLSGVSAHSSLRSLLLPLVLLPLIFPVFFSAVELSVELFATQSIGFGSFWLSLLLALLVLYTGLGCILFETVLRE
ncbi:MAG: heme exporter protein CcmB [Bdellovibrionales bacterium]|nr:heme exporter protein CcmB [Bdellovibrionales bacterium]